MTINEFPHIIDLAPLSDQRSTIKIDPEQHRMVITLQDLEDALENAAKDGKPSLADWPHRTVHFRMLSRILGGLDHPVTSFGSLLPDQWGDIPPDIRDRIPGNPRNVHMQLVSMLKRAIGLFRPDIDPWSALRVLADAEVRIDGKMVGSVQRRAERDGLNPIDIDNCWIARQLAAVPAEDETQERQIYHYLVRLSGRQLIQHAGLLRRDLALPATLLQQQCKVILPDWLQEVADASDRPTCNGLERVWRTIRHHNLTAQSPDDIMALIYAGKLQHDTAKCVQPIKSRSWRGYIQRVRQVLLSYVDDPTIYEGRLKHG